MARRETPIRLKFDPKGPMIARRAFRYAGRFYAIGTEFNARRANCSARKLKSMFLKGTLQHPEGHVVAPAPDTLPAVNDGMSMPALRKIAADEGADNANSKAGLVDNIIANRKAKAESDEDQSDEDQSDEDQSDEDQSDEDQSDEETEPT